MNGGVFPALTVSQPWATAIAVGARTIENRSRPTDYRGPVALHAAKKRVTPPRPPLYGNWPELLAALDGRDPACLPAGAVVAVFDVVGCHLGRLGPRPGGMCCAPWSDPVAGTWHWELANPRPLPVPVPARGALGLWRLDEDTARAVLAQLDTRGPVSGPPGWRWQVR